MRVLLVGPYPLDSAEVGGGVETSFAYLVSGLAELPGLELHVVSFVRGLNHAVRRTVGAVQVDHLPGSPRLGYLTRHARERKSLREVIRTRRPDVVHAQETGSSGYVCLRSAQGVPVLVTVHGIAREEVKYFSGVERLRASIFSVAVQRYCIRHARYLLQSTRYPEAYFGSEIQGRIWEIGNPISDRFFSIDSTPEAGRILFVGALIERKRLLDLVEAMPRILATVPNAHVRVAGGGRDGRYVTKVRERLRSLGLDDRVRLLGSLSGEKLLGEFQSASVLVLPSAQETSPLAIGEGMAAGLPVVATRVGGVSDLVEDGVTGYVIEPGDVETLAARTADILRQPELGAAFGAAGRANAEGRFRAVAVAARVRAIYEEMQEVTTRTVS